MSAVSLGARSGVGRWLIGGLIAGIIFAMFEMIMAAIMGQGFFAPLRLIGAIGLGTGTLPMPTPTIGLATIIPVALIIHMILSMMFGAGFGVVASAIDALRTNPVAVIVAATVVGFLLWIVNFFIIAPILFPWFGMTNQVVQFFAHTIFFGTVLGLLLAAAQQGEERSV